jgi:dihydropteroate synthase
MTARSPAAWRIGRSRTITLDRPILMGIVNVTPDSFSDGGRFDDAGRAIEHALRLVAETADLIDIGGESTRPGAAPVPADEQIRRVVPVIEGIRRRSDVPLTVDTTLAEVARAALDAGADAVNDVSACMDDDSMPDLLAHRSCGVILMHRRRRPEQESYSDRYIRPPAYDDVVIEVAAFLRERVRACEEQGIDPACVVVDPGLGFGKNVEQNFELIARIDEFTALGRPVLIGASRKSFVGAAGGEERPDQRLAGSIAAAVSAWTSGVHLFRVHDVTAHRQALSVAAAVTEARAARSKDVEHPVPAATIHRVSR